MRSFYNVRIDSRKSMVLILILKGRWILILEIWVGFVVESKNKKRGYFECTN